MIRLNKDYRLDTNELNFFLYKRGTAKDKDTGEEKEVYRQIGAYGSIKGLLKGLKEHHVKEITNTLESLENVDRLILTVFEEIAKNVERVVEDES